MKNKAVKPENIKCRLTSQHMLDVCNGYLSTFVVMFDYSSPVAFSIFK